MLGVRTRAQTTSGCSIIRSLSRSPQRFVPSIYARGTAETDPKQETAEAQEVSASDVSNDMKESGDLLFRVVYETREKAKDLTSRLRDIQRFLESLNAIIDVACEMERALREMATALGKTADEALDMFDQAMDMLLDNGIIREAPDVIILKTATPGHHRYQLRVDGVRPENADEAVATLDRGLARYRAEKCDVQPFELSTVIMLTPIEGAHA